MNGPSQRLASLVAVAWALCATPAFADEAPDLGTLAQFVRWGGVAASVPILIAALFLLRLVENAGDRLSVRFSNRRPTIQKVQTIVRFALYIVAFSLVIGLSIRLDPTALTVIGGALAFAVGFALRDLVASFIAGITIMFDRPFQVGDRVTYGGEYGDIIQIGLRSVRMNTLDHNIVTIPNNRVFTDVTSSGNYGELEMQVAMDFYVGTDQDVERAVELVREACLSSPYVFLQQPISVRAKQVILQDYVAYHLKARAYVFDCQYEKPFESDVHLRVLQAFREHDIGPPAVLHRQLAVDGSKRQG
ncbi:MAG: mechanosensitive ion channel family protein [Myxococcales bacterium]|nr:mechanosensitive ion channel family protein [Myxococcales bacterium]